MSTNFNADEILAMAEQIERNLAAFYRRAAEVTREPAAKAHRPSPSWPSGSSATKSSSERCGKASLPPRGPN